MNQKYVVLMKTEDIFEGPLKLTVYSDCKDDVSLDENICACCHFQQISEDVILPTETYIHRDIDIMTKAALHAKPKNVCLLILFLPQLQKRSCSHDVEKFVCVCISMCVVSSI